MNSYVIKKALLPSTLAPVREKGIVHNKRYYTNETAEKENWLTYAKNYSRRLGYLRKQSKEKNEKQQDHR